MMKLHSRRPIILGIDRIEWESQPVAQAARLIESADPYCMRASNFFTRTIELLNVLREPRVVLWKMEFWGVDARYERVPRSEGVDPDAYVQELMATGHHIIPYTFNAWGLDRLYSVAPTLRDCAVEILPIAQKIPTRHDRRGGDLRGFPGDPPRPLVGCGGLLHPAKGLEEIVESFLSSFPDPNAHLLCSLALEEDEDTAQIMAERWLQQFGVRGREFVHVRVGPYGDWSWMCDFYRAIDLMLVNSVSDSWGRMVSESIGFGVPVIVRRGDCGTNHIAPDVTLVDSFVNLGADGFDTAIHQARASAQRLSDYVNSHYALDAVRRMFIDVLTRNMPDHLRQSFVLQVARFGSDLDAFTIF